MSDPTFKFDWATILALVTAALIRIVFGRAMARIEKRLSGVDGLAEIRKDIAELKADVAQLKRPTLAELEKVDP